MRVIGLVLIVTLITGVAHGQPTQDQARTHALLSSSPRMLYVEPITMLQGAAAVVGIASGILGGKSNKAMRKKLDEISAKMDIVIQRQETILSEIIALRVYFKEELRASFIKEATIDLISAKNRLDVALAAQSAASRTASLKALHPEAERVAFRMKEYGPASYQTAFSAAAMLAIVNSELKVPKVQRAEAMSKISNKFSEWLLPSGPESVPLVREQAIAERLMTQQQISAYPRIHKWTISGRTYMRCSYYMNREVTISGDITNGFTATHRDYETKGSCEPGEGCRKCLANRDVETVLKPYLSARKLLIPMAMDSPYPPLNHINGLRDTWIGQSESIGRLDAMIENIGVARDALTKWGKS